MTITACILLALAQGAHADWSVFRGGPLNDGASDVELGPAPGGAPVSFATRGLVWGTPVVDREGNSYVGSSDKRFYKLGRDGKLAWSAPIFDRPDALIDSAGALTPAGKVVVPGGDGYLHAFDAASGRALWTFKATAASDSDQSAGVVVNSFEGNVQVGPNGVLYAGSDNGHLYAVRESDGTPLWSFQTKMMVWSSPALDPGARWLAFGSLDHHVYLLDPATGAKLDAFDAGSDVKASLAHDGRGNLYFGTTAGRFFRLAVTESRGSFGLRKVWSRDFGGELYSSPALTARGVVFGSLAGRVHCLDFDGKPLWTYVTHSPVAGSPVVSRDGIVVVGAKNGVVYALDAAAGTRLWSYRTAQSQLKSNIDSSPTLRPDGVIVAGSYNGLVHFIPAGHCPAHRDDARCAFGGTEDRPDFGGPVGDDEATVRLVRRDGTFTRGLDGAGRFAPITLKLVAVEKGRLLDRASIDALGIDVKLEPPAPFKTRLTSDGGSLVIIPEGLAPGVSYRIDVRGSYFHSTSWLADRFKWFGLRSFAGEVTVTAAAADSGRPAELPAHWAMGSLYLKQPQSLDTYIPAGLDGQAFIGTPFAASGDGGASNGPQRFLLLMLPALPSLDGAPIPLAEPARAFVFEGERDGRDLRASGAMTVSAMGGTIPFRSAGLTARLHDDGGLDSGEFLIEASCLALRGNGSSYKFPMQMLATTCDYGLRLYGLGTFSAGALATAPVPPASAGHLVSVVRYDPATLRVTGSAFSIEGNGCVAGDGKVPVCPLKLNRGSKKPSDSDLVRIFVDSEQVAAFPARAWPGLR